VQRREVHSTAERFGETTLSIETNNLLGTGFLFFNEKRMARTKKSNTSPKRPRESSKSAAAGGDDSILSSASANSLGTFSRSVRLLVGKAAEVASGLREKAQLYARSPLLLDSVSLMVIQGKAFEALTPELKESFDSFSGRRTPGPVFWRYSHTYHLSKVCEDGLQEISSKEAKERGGRLCLTCWQLAVSDKGYALREAGFTKPGLLTAKMMTMKHQWTLVHVGSHTPSWFHLEQGCQLNRIGISQCAFVSAIHSDLILCFLCHEKAWELKEKGTSNMYDMCCWPPAKDGDQS
jgi:hypothetical protein